MIERKIGRKNGEKKQKFNCVERKHISFSIWIQFQWCIIKHSLSVWFSLFLHLLPAPRFRRFSILSLRNILIFFPLNRRSTNSHNQFGLFLRHFWKCSVFSSSIRNFQPKVLWKPIVNIVMDYVRHTNWFKSWIKSLSSYFNFRPPFFAVCAVIQKWF